MVDYLSSLLSGDKLSGTNEPILRELGTREKFASGGKIGHEGGTPRLVLVGEGEVELSKRRAVENKEG